MQDEVDANADPIWAAVGSETTVKGEAARQPRSDAEWKAVRRHAVVLLEATNLLLIPGRQVAAQPFASAGPGVYSSSQVQQRIDQHRQQFNAHALGLQAIVQAELRAIDKHDAAGLQALGEGMDNACEACHRDNWYPHEKVPTLPFSPPRAG